jgi:perosamine synthetase
MQFIPLSVPHLAGNEWTYVKECLDGGWVSSAGPFVTRFERELAAYVGAAHAVACVNGTAALHVALRLAGVEENDEVLVPTLTFIASVNAICYQGARPVFMDCDEYYNLDVDKVARFLHEHTDFSGGYTVNRTTGRRIKAIVPVHVFGNAARLEPLVRLCRERNIRIIEDATESLGTRYNADYLGGAHTGTVGDFGCFSFNGNKIITTGGGGMLVTNDAEAAERARYLTTQAKDDEVRYVHGDIGYNYRLTNVQAALGVAQLETLPAFLRTKRKNWEAYRAAVAEIEGLRIAPGPNYADNNYWMYALQIDAARYGKDREQLMEHLRRAGIQSRPVWHLNHLQKPFVGEQHFEIEKAFELAEITLNIPCSTNLTDAEVARVVDALRQR